MDSIPIAVLASPGGPAPHEVSTGVVSHHLHPTADSPWRRDGSPSRVKFYRPRLGLPGSLERMARRRGCSAAWNPSSSPPTTRSWPSNVMAPSSTPHLIERRRYVPGTSPPPLPRPAATTIMRLLRAGSGELIHGRAFATRRAPRSYTGSTCRVLLPPGTRAAVASSTHPLTSGTRGRLRGTAPGRGLGWPDRRKNNTHW